MIILVDMDGVIADFEKGFLDSWKKIHPHLNYVEIKNRKTFYARDEPIYDTNLAESIVLLPGFYKSLPPITGAIDALKELSTNNDVYICTSPRTKNFYSIYEKYEWIDNYLGSEWIKRTIPTKDKTIIRGDILIDDNPNKISGILKPSWKHILFSQPYNSGEFNWYNYRRFI